MLQVPGEGARFRGLVARWSASPRSLRSCLLRGIRSCATQSTLRPRASDHGGWHHLERILLPRRWHQQLQYELGLHGSRAVLLRVRLHRTEQHPRGTGIPPLRADRSLPRRLRDAGCRGRLQSRRRRRCGLLGGRGDCPRSQVKHVRADVHRRQHVPRLDVFFRALLQASDNTKIRDMQYGGAPAPSCPTTFPCRTRRSRARAHGHRLGGSCPGPARARSQA